MKQKQTIQIKICYILTEASCPKEFRPDMWIKIDPREFDLHKASVQAFEIGGWIPYEITNNRIKMQHSQQEMWEAIYLRRDIN